MTPNAVARAERALVPTMMRGFSGRVRLWTRRAVLYVATVCAVAGPSTATALLAPAWMQEADTLGLAEILERLSGTYAAMSDYVDRGHGTTKHPGEAWSEPPQTFTTHFTRFTAFTWTSDLGRGDEYGVVVDGARVVHVWNGTRTTMTSVGDAVGRGAGVSHLSSVWIPALLMPDALQGRGLRGLISRATSATRLPDEAVNERPCFVIAFTDDGATFRVWISRRDFLIRRIEQRYARYNSITTTDYTPHTDISLTP